MRTTPSPLAEFATLWGFSNDVASFGVRTPM